MKPSKSSQTNWKYIFIIVILATITTGGTLWLSNRKEVSTELPEIKKPEKITEDKIAEDKIANWKTYKNEEHGYQIKLPADWERHSETWILPHMTTSWFHPNSNIKDEHDLIRINIVCGEDKPSGEVILKGRKIVHIPRNEYVYVIKVPMDFVSKDDFNLILSTFKFTEMQEEFFGWESFWTEHRKRGCYNMYKPKCPPEESFDFSSLAYISFTTEVTYPTIEKFAEENSALHQALLEKEGVTGNEYRDIWAHRGEEWFSRKIQVGHIDLTNDGEKDAIVMFRGGMAGRSYAVGIFQFKEGVYHNLLDKNIRFSNFAVKSNTAQLVEIAPIYFFDEGLCCPINYALIYYKLVEGKFKIDKIIDNYGYDITDIYPTLRSCSYNDTI